MKGDHIQIAAVLADRVVDLARDDVTISVVEEAAARLGAKRVIQPRSAGVRAPVEQTIFEVSRFPGLAASPDLVAPDRSGEFRVGPEARSLYGWMWPKDRFETLLANASAGESVVGAADTKHIQRQRWPDGHPYLSSPGEKIPFRTLADRLVTIHQTARSRIRESNVRPNRPEDDLGSAIFELVQNAHTHGARDRRDIWLTKQTRVLRTATRRFNRNDCSQTAISSLPLAEWMGRHLDIAKSDSSEMAIIDVIDNGIGLAQRAASLLGEYGTLDSVQEFNFLRNALAKSTRQGSHRMSAEGFARVQLLMTDLGGAVSIRTGRTVLFRDFLEKPYQVGPLDLFAEWVPPGGAQALPSVRGTVVTMIIPTR